MTEIVMSPSPTTDEKTEIKVKTYELWRQSMLTSYTCWLRMYGMWLWMYPEMQKTLIQFADELDKNVIRV